MLDLSLRVVRICVDPRNGAPAGPDSGPDR
jgi:hypothetical protein